MHLQSFLDKKALILVNSTEHTEHTEHTVNTVTNLNIKTGIGRYFFYDISKSIIKQRNYKLPTLTNHGHQSA